MRIWIAAACISAAACSRSPAMPVRGEPAASASPAATPPGAVAPPSATATAAAAPTVPAELPKIAAEFGIAMTGDGWQWTKLDRIATRFDWSGRPAGKPHEVRWSFWLKGKDMRSMPLPQVVQSAAFNLTSSKQKACPPLEQPSEIAQMLGADRVITVCFEPAPHVTEEARHGVLHGLVRADVLVIVMVLSNDRTGTVPSPDDIGGRFAP